VTRKISQQNPSTTGTDVHAISMCLFKSAELQKLNSVEKILSDEKALIARTQNENLTLKLAA